MSDKARVFVECWPYRNAVAALAVATVDRHSIDWRLYSIKLADGRVFTLRIMPRSKCARYVERGKPTKGGPYLVDRTGKPLDRLDAHKIALHG